MAEAILSVFHPKLEVFSAGTEPSNEVHPKAIAAIEELGLSLINMYPKNVDIFLNGTFDYVITVCDGAKETCPVFLGKVKNRLHIGFPDPAEAIGTEEEIFAVFRQVRDDILRDFFTFYQTEIKAKL